MKTRVLLIDNYDSFTYNLSQALQVLGAEVHVRLQDRITPGEAAALAPTHLVISPGPGRPEGAGGSMEMIRTFRTQVPILGVCLGHQALAAVLGGEIVPAWSLLHGKASAIHHDGRSLYQGLPNPFQAGRYHSLAVNAETLPRDLEVSAYTSDGEIMGLRHRGLPVEGVQFHPESVLTPEGSLLLRNFLDLEPAEGVGR